MNKDIDITKITKPKVIYFQTITECNGHCRYCPFDDVYSDDNNYAVMETDTFRSIIEQLKEWDYRGIIGFVLHYEPTLDERLPDFIKLIREMLPLVSIEIATNGLISNSPIFKHHIDSVKVVKAGSLTNVTSRAGNVGACPEIIGRKTFKSLPKCDRPKETMCIAANGDILLCCQDWRHEAVIGNVNDIIGARKEAIKLISCVENLELQICKDCSQGLTYEEIADRVGRRSLIYPGES